MYTKQIKMQILRDNLILLTLGDSHDYGTNIRGVAIERPKELFQNI